MEVVPPTSLNNTISGQCFGLCSLLCPSCLEQSVWPLLALALVSSIDCDCKVANVMLLSCTTASASFPGSRGVDFLAFCVLSYTCSASAHFGLCGNINLWNLISKRSPLKVDSFGKPDFAGHLNHNQNLVHKW